MNIFLDKSLPKSTRIVLQILRMLLLILIFGGFFYASFNPAVQDVIIYTSIFLAIAFIVIKIIVERRRKSLIAEERLNKATEVQGSSRYIGINDTTGNAKRDEAGNKK